MKISLILATLNREELALKAINSVFRQSFKDWEIVIVDQTNEPCSLLEALAGKDKRIVYIHINQKGLSHARNVGIKAASGDVIGLMDDDAVYEECALKTVNQIFENNPGISSVYGKLVDPRDKEKYVKKNFNTLITWHNFMSTCISACSFIKKSFFNTYSFDENLGVGCYMGSAEESDVFAKLLEEKKRGLFNPSIVIYHYIPTPSEAMANSNLDKHKSYCRGFGGFCAKHIIKFKSNKVLFVYIKAMIRTFCGFILSVVKRNPVKQNFYKTTLTYRNEGYKSYKKILAGESSL